VVASLIVGAVFLLVMVIASVRGAVILPADARIPVHAGSVEHCYMASKKTGLLIWPGAGALAFGVLGGVGASSLAAGWTAGVRVVLAPAVLGVLLAFQVGALALARREGSAIGAKRGGGR
jgi:L-aminopeptidase/D-esterase-like protein